MTSVPSQQQHPAQAHGTAAPSVAPVPTPSSTTGTSQQAAAGRSFGISNNRQGSLSNVGSATHGKIESISSASGKGPIQPAVPTIGGPTIVNGNNAVSPTSHHFEHSRKSSITISATGASGQMPNGGPVAGKPAMGNGIPVQFGQINTGASPDIGNARPHIGPSAGSLGVAAPTNPRVTSPQTSPSPIPQPAASGGPPRSSFHSQGNSLSFGSIGDEASVCSQTESGERALTIQQRQARPSMSGVPSGSLTPGLQSAQLRREPSQQSNSDMANGNINMNGGRGGYHSQSNRGRNYNQPLPQMPYSPNPSYRNAPNAPRGAQGMSSPFLNQGSRPMGPFPPHSPAARSPALAQSQPIHQAGQLPMPSPGMASQHYPGYGPHMAQQQVNSQFHSANSFPSQPQDASGVAPAHFINGSAPIALPNTLSPESGQFEAFLTKHGQGHFVPYDAYQPYYTAAPYPMPQPMPMQGFNPQQSPRPSFGSQHGQQQFVPGQYGQPQPMSRTPSGIADRPPSTAGQPPTPMTPAVSVQQQTQNRAVSSPGPKSTEFRIPKKSAIVIKDPSSGLVKTFDKTPDSPAVTAPSKSPVTVSTTSTPPPRTPSHSDSHNRTESKTAQSNSEMVRKFKEDIANKLVADKAEEERTKQEVVVKDTPATAEAEAKSEPEISADEKATEDIALVDRTKDAVEASIADPDKPETEEAVSEELETPEEPEIKGVPTVEISDAKPVEDSKAEVNEPAGPEVDEDSDEYWERIEAEERRREEEMERAYQAKKKAQAEEKARKEAEANARLDEELKRAEREAEAREEERMKKLDADEGDDEQEKKDLFATLKKNENAFKATQTSSVDTPASGVATPASEASSMGPPAPPKVTGQGKNKPAALKLNTAEKVEAPQPSAALQSLRSARFLQKIDDTTYPAAIASPNPALNSAAPMGKFRYDKNFLMQFQTVFTEKPSETWNERVKETVGDTSETPGSARPRGGPGNTMPPRSASRPSVINNFGPMGAFGGQRTLPPGTTSQDRFEMSNPKHMKSGPGSLRYNPSQPGAFPMPFPSAMQRTPSSTSIGHPQSPRTNTNQRGSQRGSKAGKRETDKEAKTMPLTAGQDVKPIEVTATGWKPRSIGASAIAGPPPGGDGYLAPDVVQRKVKAALNKMTPTTFDKITSQILDIVMQSKRETDGRTLRQVIQLTFEKATDEAHWAQMYAEFCSRMLHSMTPEIKDETLGLDKHGNVNAGSTLFRKYLLNRCQQDFETGWKSKLPDKPDGEGTEAAMLSDEYYAAAAAKRRGLGLVKFIGELFKLGMLTSRIMHMCLTRLLNYEGMPEEAEVESLASLMKTIGHSLDAEEKSRQMMDAYIARIGDMTKIEGLPSRLRFMLMVCAVSFPCTVIN